MEHGGFNEDDVKVPIIVSAPFITGAGTSIADAVTTTQVAPTILQLLGVDPNLLQVRSSDTFLLVRSGSFLQTEDGKGHFDCLQITVAKTYRCLYI